jgi:hypothetical protein
MCIKRSGAQLRLRLSSESCLSWERPGECTLSDEEFGLPLKGFKIRRGAANIARIALEAGFVLIEACPCLSANIVELQAAIAVRTP